MIVCMTSETRLNMYNQQPKCIYLHNFIMEGEVGRAELRW